MKEDSRNRQAETMKARYGPDVFSKIGKMKTQPLYLARWASWHRWHPDRFDTEGRLLPEYEKEFYRVNNSKDK